MAYITGQDRRQATLLPPVIDDYIAEDAQVRVIDAFVDGLNFGQLGFQRAAPASTGRPGYDPRDLQKLYNLWLPQRGPLVAPARARMQAQRRGDVACAAARTRSQDDR